MNPKTKRRVLLRSRKRQMYINEKSDDRPQIRIDILLLISTFLFGITVQFINKLEGDSSNSDNWGWLFLEIATMLLFSAYLYLLASWNSSERSFKYQIISVYQMIVLNGLLISIIITYAISHFLTENSGSLAKLEDMYPVVLFSVFVLIPIFALSRTPQETLRVIGIQAFISKNLELPGAIGAITIGATIAVLTGIAFAYTSKVTNIIALFFLIVYLPYIGLKIEDTLEMFPPKDTIEKYSIYTLGIYNSYFWWILILFGLLDILGGRLSPTAFGILILIIFTMYIASINAHTRKARIIIAVFLIILGLVSTIAIFTLETQMSILQLSAMYFLILASMVGAQMALYIIDKIAIRMKP